MLYDITTTYNNAFSGANPNVNVEILMRINKQHPKFAEHAANGDISVPRMAYSLREFAAALGVHYLTVYRMVRRGLLGVVRAEGVRQFMVPVHEAERFLRDHVTYAARPGRGGPRNRRKKQPAAQATNAI
jgi:excisionase family DNA binding protein